MIEYDKERITDLAYVKDLLEGKYIISDEVASDEGYEMAYITKINKVDTFTGEYIDVDFDFFWVSKYPSGRKSININGTYMRLQDFLKDYSFITKDEFMRSFNEVVEEIQKGADK